MKKYESVEAYFEDLSPTQADRLTELRELVLQAVPEAQEGISYGMPSYKYYGQLAYIGAFEKHFSFFPGAHLSEFAEQLTGYGLGKGTLQIKYDQSIPKDVIRQMLVYKMEVNRAKKSKKAK